MLDESHKLIHSRDLFMGVIMRILASTIMAAVLSSAPAAAQDAAVTDAISAQPVLGDVANRPQPDGKIVMYRQGSVMGMALGCPIRYKGQEIVELGRNKFAEWEVPAGNYILSNKTSSVDLTVFPGQTKYVRCVIKPGFMTGRADLQTVDAETFMQNAAEYERKEVVAPVGGVK